MTVNQEPDLVRSRSDQARGRSLILPEADLNHLSEEILEQENDVYKSEQIVFVKESKDILKSNDEEQKSEIDFVIDFSSSKPTLDLNLKIGVFVGVALGVLIITGKFNLILHH